MGLVFVTQLPLTRIAKVVAPRQACIQAADLLTAARRRRGPPFNEYYVLTSLLQRTVNGIVRRFDLAAPTVIAGKMNAQILPVP